MPTTYNMIVQMKLIEKKIEQNNNKNYDLRKTYLWIKTKF